MTSSAIVSRLAFAGALLVASACAKLEADPPPAITTDGPHAVAVGATITLTATTRHGVDPEYTFASEDVGIATVDGAGVVTGVAAGETLVRVTGSKTKAAATHAVVVVAAVAFWGAGRWNALDHRPFGLRRIPLPQFHIPFVAQLFPRSAPSPTPAPTPAVAPSPSTEATPEPTPAPQEMPSPTPPA